MKTLKSILRAIFIAIGFTWCAFIIAYSIVGECEASTTIRTDNTENALTIPVQSPSATLAKGRNVYCIPVDFKKGDIVLVSGQVEVTTELSYPVMYGSYLALGPTCYTHDFKFSKPQATNITREQHHYAEKISASRMIDSDYKGYISLVIYSANKYRSGSIKVEQGYGNMSVVIIRQ